MRDDITFLISTYNRQASCQRLVDSLQGLGSIIVLNDGCRYNINGCNQYFKDIHGGKVGYWQTVNILFKLRGSSKYYFMLPDDFLPKPDMIRESIKLWIEIEDSKKICLSLGEPRIGKSCWTGFMPIDSGNVYLTQWMDMCFMCENMFFNRLGIIREIRFNLMGKKNISSGVGAYISRKLYKNGFNLYQVKESLITIQPEHYISQMHNVNNRTDSIASRQRK
jgi:hypothetical protein